MKRNSKRWKKNWILKNEINLRTFTLSQAIYFERNKNDFSCKSEVKVLALIYEHVLYHKNYSIQSNTWMGPLSEIGDSIAYDLLDTAGYEYSAIDKHLPEISEICQRMIGRAYFCFEIDKSIAILTNPKFVTNGQCRVMILELLRNLKTVEENRINGEIETISPVIFPVENPPPFNREMPGGVRQHILFSLIRDISKWGRLARVPVLKSLQEIKNSRRGIPSKSNITNVNMLISSDLSSRIISERDRIQQSPFIRPRSVTPPGIRWQMHKKMELLFEQAQRSRHLSPGDKITIYKNRGDYYTQEESEIKGIPVKITGLTLDYIDNETYRSRCDELLSVFNGGSDNTNDRVSGMELMEYLAERF